MATIKPKRQRLIIDLPAKILMGIKLRAIKSDMTNSEIVATAFEITFPEAVREAEETLAKRKPK